MLGLSVLVVEEEYLIAAEIEATLLAKGAATVLVARDVERVGPLPPVDLAVIEAKLGAPAVIAFATLLREAGVPVVVTSADGAVLSLFTGSVPLEKPFDDNSLLAACEAALRLGSRLPQV